jgi:hypothetical protein
MSNDENNATYAPGAILYPNAKSYKVSNPASPAGRKTLTPTTTPGAYAAPLRKARIYSVKQTLGELYEKYPGAPGSYALGRKTLDTKLSKTFQFNPPEIQMRMYTAPTDNPEDAPDGVSTATTNLQLGLASTDLSMFFERKQEVHTGRIAGGKYAEYGRLGIAKDILDVFAIIKGDEAMMDAGENKTLTALTSEMTDLVSNGSQLIMQGFVAIQYSPDFTFYGQVTEMAFRFVQFNHAMVPTMGFIDIGLEVHRVDNQAQINSEFASAIPELANSTTTTPGLIGDILSGWADR